MEIFNDEYRKKQQRSKILSGVLVIAFGTLFLMDRAGMNIPNWLYSWEMILVAVGVVSIAKNPSQAFGYILMAIGGVFLINEFKPDTIDQQLIIPALVIVIGVSILWKGLGFGKKCEKKTTHFQTVVFDESKENSTSDYFESKTVFGGTEKNVVSKNFRGAKITSIFGGTEINLTNADLQQPATIDTTTIFGGLTIAVPANWRVQSELTTVFGGVEDKRPLVNSSETEDHKVLILTGNCFFGGVEIHSYL